jgi:uncharacterized protein
MQYLEAGTSYILRIDKGEDVVKAITEFCAKEGIVNAYFTGIGAVDVLKCGYYNLEEKKYYFKDYDEPLEVVSLTGNVMLKDNENRAFGGHIVEMRVHVVLEVMLTPLQSNIERVLDDCIGLALLKMD